MKRHISWLVLVPCLLGWPALLPAGRAQQSPAAAIAHREAAEDAYNRLLARIEKLEEGQTALQQRIEAVEKGLRDLHEEMTRATSSAVTPESLRRLAEQIQKVDDTRLAEHKNLRDSIENLYKILKDLAAAPLPPPPARPASAPSASGTNRGSGATYDEGFEYIVQKGDVLSGIVQKYRENNVKVTQKMVMEANPKVKDWDRLQVNQKLFIPKPKN